MTFIPAFIPATEKQLYWIEKVVDEKVISEEMRTDIKCGLKRMDISKEDAKKYLDVLFDKNTPSIPVVGAPTEEGFYLHEDNVYRVKRSKISGNLYAQLVTAHGFNYELGKGMMKVLKADMLMSVEQICTYGLQTGVCANCATPLSDPISIFIGLGTSCGPKLMGKQAYNAAKHAAKADPNTQAALAAKEQKKSGGVTMELIGS